MAQAVLPRGERSVTAAQDLADIRDDEVYSAACLQHGGSSQVTMFSIPKGQAIPALKGSAITPTTQPHQAIYSELTTNLNKAGEFGNAIGDVAVRKVHITFEQASYGADGAQFAYGATPSVLAEILNKTYFKLTVGQKDYLKGPTFRFGAGGGVYGSVSSTETSQVVGMTTNGIPGPGRVLKMPIQIERKDTVEAQLGVASNASLNFGVNSADGQPTLAWVNLVSNVRADVR